MTRSIFFTLLVIGQLSYGQSIDSISKISFSYSRGHSSWGNPGNYGISEYIEYKPSSDKKFTLTRFFRVTYSVGQDGKTFHKDTLELPTKKHSPIEQKSIHTWLINLNTHKDNYTETFIKRFLTTPTKKEVKTTAKSIENRIFFDRDYKEEKQNVLRKIQNFAELDSFLIRTKPTVEFIMLVTDVWDHLKIEIINNSDTAIYENQFYFDPLGQPVSRKDYKDINKVGNTINIETNICARFFLPRKSLTYKILDINNIKSSYIKWWLEKDL